MGFWDVGIGDLEAIGVRVSEEAAYVLEEGGDVLFVAGLLSPYACYGDDTGILDQHDKQVYVPRLLTAYPPREQAPGWSDTPANILEDAFGPEWRTWPSFVGEVEERNDYQRSFSDMTYVRVWDGTPVFTVEDASIADELMAAATARVKNSVYAEFVMLADWESEEAENSLDNLDLGLDGTLDLLDLAEFTGTSRAQLDALVSAYDTLLTGGYLNRDGSEGRPVQFEPMEAYLPVSPSARRAWAQMVARRDNSIEIINCALPRARGKSFAQGEREYM